jgi:hypothetical protein
MNLIDQLPPSIEWYVYSGDTARLTLFVVDADDQPIDLSEYTFEGQIRFTPSHPEAEFVLTVTGTEDGVVTINIEDTASLANQMYFDIQSTSPEDVVNTILRGVIIKEQDVTR